ncbi:MAG: GNAT family N-acetyltransferase [bacterium]|nr:GNAT family N-acetyltransferase [bacterium]
MVRIRAARVTDASPIARVHIDSWRATYAGLMPAGFLRSLSYPERASWWEEILAKDPPAMSTFVAEAPGGEVVGFVGGGREREANADFGAELYAIYVYEDYQRRGVGRRLVSALAGALSERGLSSMLLWVLEDNPGARSFYESLGGEELGTQTITIGGEDLTEVAYGWRDIESLRE